MIDYNDKLNKNDDSDGIISINNLNNNNRNGV